LNRPNRYNASASGAKNRCPRCGASAKGHQTGRSFADSEIEKQYYKLTEEIDEARENEGDEDEIEDLREQRRALAKSSKVAYELICEECGYMSRPPSPDGLQAYGYAVYVDSKYGGNSMGVIYRWPNSVYDDEIARHLVYATDPKAAYLAEEASLSEGESLPEFTMPKYVRITVWDEDTQSVKVLAERGNRSAWKR